MKNRPLSTLNLTIIGMLGAVGGIWLIIMPFLLGYSDDKTPGSNAQLLSIICGAIAIVVSLLLVVTEKNEGLKTLRFYGGAVMVFIGIWVMSAPYLFNYSKPKNELWGLQITGGLIALVAGFVVQEIYTRSKE